MVNIYVGRAQVVIDPKLVDNSFIFKNRSNKRKIRGTETISRLEKLGATLDKI